LLTNFLVNDDGKRVRASNPNAEPCVGKFSPLLFLDFHSLIDFQDDEHVAEVEEVSDAGFCVLGRPFDSEAKRLNLFLELRDLHLKTHALFNPKTTEVVVDEEEKKEDKTPDYVLTLFKRVQTVIFDPDYSLLDGYRYFSKLRLFCEKGYSISMNFMLI
jgi:hypothetical protein